MVKNDIWLGIASKQNACFMKIFAPKNAPMPLMSRIGPAILSCGISHKKYMRSIQKYYSKVYLFTD